MTKYTKRKKYTKNKWQEGRTFATHVGGLKDYIYSFSLKKKKNRRKKDPT